MIFRLIAVLLFANFKLVLVYPKILQLGIGQKKETPCYGCNKGSALYFEEII